MITIKGVIILLTIGFVIAGITIMLYNKTLKQNFTLIKKIQE